MGPFDFPHTTGKLCLVHGVKHLSKGLERGRYLMSARTEPDCGRSAYYAEPLSEDLWLLITNKQDQRAEKRGVRDREEHPCSTSASTADNQLLH